MTVSNESEPTNLIMVKKLAHDQNTISFYISKLYHMVFLKILDNYYIPVIQQYLTHHLSTSISSKQRCHHINELFNSTIIKLLPLIRRVKYYSLLCQNRTEAWCFFDEIYMCLCTIEQDADCSKSDHQTKLICKQNGYCKNVALDVYKIILIVRRI